MIVLDTNVLMELLERRRYFTEVLEVLQKYQTEAQLAAISALTVSNVFYLAERFKVAPKNVELMLAGYRVLDVLAQDVEWALGHYARQDFEDALQVAVAIRVGCKAFLTIDSQLARKYGALVPVELIS
jgi:predicted nucleic acid-binding protein